MAVLIVVAIIVWRRRRSPDGERGEDTSLGDSSESDTDLAIEIPVDPEDELEKDAVVVKALKGRSKSGGE